MDREKQRKAMKDKLKDIPKPDFAAIIKKDKQESSKVKEGGSLESFRNSTKALGTIVDPRRQSLTRLNSLKTLQITSDIVQP